MSFSNFIVQFLKTKMTSDILLDDEASIAELFHKEEFKKKETIFRNGDANTKHYLIESGLLRMYIIDKNGREFNVLFAKENQIIGDLITPAPTSFNLEAVEAATVYSISDEGIKKLMKSMNYTEMSEYFGIVRASYINLQKRLVNMMANTAEENFIMFRDSNPDLIQRLPQYHIAAYLGISAEFMSKIIAKSVKK